VLAFGRGGFDTEPRRQHRKQPCHAVTI